MNLALGPDRRGAWERTDPDAERALRAIERMAVPVEVSVEELFRRLRAARVVFIPDVHDETRRHDAIADTLDALALAEDSVGRFDALGLEFLYEPWVDLPAADLQRNVSAAFTLGGPPGSADSIGAWTTRFVLRARDVGWRVIALNSSRFSEVKLPEFSSGLQDWNEDERPIPAPEFRVGPPDNPDQDSIIARDEWVAQTIEATAGRLIVIYGRDHILSGRLTEIVRDSLVLVPFDRELWRVACDRMDLRQRSASERVAVQLTERILLFNLGTSQRHRRRD